MPHRLLAIRSDKHFQLKNKYFASAIKLGSRTLNSPYCLKPLCVNDDRCNIFMVKQFQIIHAKVHHNRGLFIFARHLGGNHNFKVTEGAILRDLPVYHYIELQLKEKENDEPQKDIFVFRPMDMSRLFDNSFNNGDIVTLTFSE